MAARAPAFPGDPMAAGASSCFPLPTCLKTEQELLSVRSSYLSPYGGATGCDPLPFTGEWGQPRTQPNPASLVGDNAPRHPGGLKLSHTWDMMPHSPVSEM